GLNAPARDWLRPGSEIVLTRPSGKWSTCTWQPAVHPGIQAISPGLAAIMFSNERVTRRVPGSHSSHLPGPDPATSGTSNRPARVAWSTTYPAGSVSLGPSAAPVTLTCCAVAAAALMSAPGR